MLSVAGRTIREQPVYVLQRETRRAAENFHLPRVLHGAPLKIAVAVHPLGSTPEGQSPSSRGLAQLARGVADLIPQTAAAVAHVPTYPNHGVEGRSGRRVGAGPKEKPICSGADRDQKSFLPVISVRMAIVWFG